MPKTTQTLTTLGVAVLAGALDAFIAVAPAHASLVADGITYTLTETATANPLVSTLITPPAATSDALHRRIFTALMVRVY